jgi:hypothetical protein
MSSENQLSEYSFCINLHSKLTWFANNEMIKYDFDIELFTDRIFTCCFDFLTLVFAAASTFGRTSTVNAAVIG